MIDPSILLDSHPVSIETPLQAQQGALSIANLGQQNQLQAAQLQSAQMQNQQQAQDMQDQQNLRRAYMDAGGDLDKTQTLAMQYGVSPKALMALRSSALQTRTQLAALDKATLDNEQTRNDALSGMLTPIASEPDPAKQAALWNQSVGQAVQRGLMTPQDAAAHPYPGAAGVSQYVASLKTTDQLIKQATADAAQKRGDAAMIDAGNNTAKTNAEMPGLQADASQKQLASYAQQLAAAKDQPSYAAALGEIPQKFASHFPATYDPNTTQAAVLRAGLTPAQGVAADQRSAEIAKLNSPAELAMQASKGNKDAQAALEYLQRMNIAERQASTPNITLTPDAQNMLANNFRNTGSMPSFPRGPGAGIVSSVINQAAAQDPNANLGLNKATYKADSGALVALQKQRDTVGAFEQTASKNLDQFLSLASKLPDSGIPWVNAPLRMVDQQVAGDSNIAAVNAARQIANNEIAKVTTSPGLSGALSDSARHEVESYNPQNATFAQTLAVAKVLRNDLANRPAALDQQIMQVKNRMASSIPVSHSPQPGTAAAPATAGQKSLSDIFGTR